MKFNVFKKCLNVLQSGNGVFHQLVTIDTSKYLYELTFIWCVLYDLYLC